jgi:hypothetical protein
MKYHQNNNHKIKYESILCYSTLIRWLIIYVYDIKIGDLAAIQIALFQNWKNILLKYLLINIPWSNYVCDLDNHFKRLFFKT